MRYKFHSKKGLRGYSHPKVIVNRKILYIAFMLAFMMSAHKNQENFSEFQYFQEFNKKPFQNDEILINNTILSKID